MKTNLFFFPKNNRSNIYQVILQEDGTLFVTLDGKKSIDRVGLFIRDLGGVESLLAKCVEDTRSLAEMYAAAEAQRKAARKAKRLKAEQKAEQKEQEAEEELRRLQNASPDNVIEATLDNLAVVARYLAAINWGVWQMPQMSISYSAIPYEGGAVAIKLDRPIAVDGKDVSRLAYGARHGELPEYYRIRI